MSPSVDDLSLQEISVDLSILQRADGSARLVQGDTSVLCGIFGPREVRSHVEHAQHATLEVLVNPENGHPSQRDRALERDLFHALSSMILLSAHPRSSITVICQIERANGSVADCCLNTACLALMEAGIPLKSMFAACSIAKLARGRLVVNPTRNQEAEAEVVLSVGITNAKKDIFWLVSHGSQSPDDVGPLAEKASDIAVQILTFLRTAISSKVETMVPTQIKEQ
jgi:exosome complex component RRP46